MNNNIKHISFFLASSIIDVRSDRLEIGDFINQLNQMYTREGIFIDLYKCEDESISHVMTPDGSQKALDDIIEESDLCFIIFYRKVGNVTEHELDIAYNAFKKTLSKPKIVVYFKTLPEGEEISSDIQAIMNKIDNELKYYHRQYSHIDSIKLGIVTQLQANGFISSSMNIQDNAIYSNGIKLVSTTDIPLFSNNKELNELFDDYSKLDETANSLLKQFESNKENNELYNKYLEVTQNKLKIKSKIDSLSKNILEIGNKLAKMSLNDTITDKIRTAIKYIDEGNYLEVLNLLTVDSILDGISALDARDRETLAERETYLEELRLRILALKAMANYKEVESNYDIIANQIMQHPQLPKSLLIEYADYLFDQNNYEKCMDLCKKMLFLFEFSKDRTLIIDIANLHNLIGKIYYKQLDYSNAKHEFEQAIDCVGENHTFDIQKADYITNLAKANFLTNDYADAEVQYAKAKLLLKTYCTPNNYKCRAKLAHIYTELGNLYYMINRHEDASYLFKKACSELNQLYEYDQIQFGPLYADACNKYAYLHIAIFSHIKTDICYYEALKKKTELDQKDPIEYYRFLQNISTIVLPLIKANSQEYYLSVSTFFEKLKIDLENNKYNAIDKDFPVVYNFDFYNNSFDKDAIKSACENAINIYTELAKNNPEAYNDYLATSYSNFAYYNALIGEHKISVEYFEKSIELKKLMLDTHKNVNYTPLAVPYYNLALNYFFNNEFDKAKDECLVAMKIYENATTISKDAFYTNLAKTNLLLGNIFVKKNNFEDANNHYLKALSLYLDLYVKNPQAYIDRILSVVGWTLALYSPTKYELYLDKILEL